MQDGLPGVGGRSHNGIDDLEQRRLGADTQYDFSIFHQERVADLQCLECAAETSSRRCHLASWTRLVVREVRLRDGRLVSRQRSEARIPDHAYSPILSQKRQVQAAVREGLPSQIEGQGHLDSTAATV